jgi:hypothetical protein
MDSAPTSRPTRAVTPTTEVGIGFDTPHAAQLPLDLDAPRERRTSRRRSRKAPRSSRAGRQARR